MHSFLMLPMQRITRLPLLAEAVVSRLPTDSPHLAAAKEALHILNGLVTECNESTRYLEYILVLSLKVSFVFVH